MTKAEALAQVNQLIASCEICPHLCRAATHPVPGEGNPDARIMFVGEAPGAKEDKTGRPFVGAAGKFLDVMLASIGLRREDVFITSIVKYRPPENRDPTATEIADSLPILQRQIEIIDPELIVLLGRHATSVFLPDLRISESHGHAKRVGGKVYLPLYHPAAALYNGGLRDTLLQDFSYIPSILETINNSKLKQ